MAGRQYQDAVSEVEGQLCRDPFASNLAFLRLLLDGIQGKGVWWDRGVSFVRPDGREVPLEINTSLLEDELGQTTGAVGIFRDPLPGARARATPATSRPPGRGRSHGRHGGP